MSATTRGPLDRPNGDLKAGDKIVIVGWCGDLERVPQQRGQPCRLVLSHDGIQVVPDEEDRLHANRALFGYLLEVLAVSYPYAIMQMHSVLANGGRGSAQVTLCLTEFEAAHATPEFVAAMIPPPPPAPTPAPSGPAGHAIAAPIATTILDGRHYQGHPEHP